MKEDSKTHNKNFWQESWDIHLDQYLDSAPRLGIFLQYYFKDDVRDVLEIACGCSKDSVFLARNRKKVTAADYEEKTLAKVKIIYDGISNIAFRLENAFNLSFKSKSFDLSFHNGFFILFPEDEKIFKLIQEQARVTRKYIVIAVHNSNNQRLRNRFRELAQTDKLYDVRFFAPAEIISIIKRSGLAYREITTLKFGGIFDALYQKRIKSLPNPLIKQSDKIVPALYKYLPWRNTERVLVVVKL